MEHHLIMKNRYLFLRHGESKANTKRKIVSRLETDKKGDYGLTKYGREQVIRSMEEWGKRGILSSETIIVSSEFRRAKETAGIASRSLGTSNIIVYRDLCKRNFGKLKTIKLKGGKKVFYIANKDLCERDFGAFDNKKEDSFYKAAWEMDKIAPLRRWKGIESAFEVFCRIRNLINKFEDECEGKIILLVSHCDPIQIFLTVFLGFSLTRHRDLCPPYGPIENGEIRELPDRHWMP